MCVYICVCAATHQMLLDPNNRNRTIAVRTSTRIDWQTHWLLTCTVENSSTNAIILSANVLEIDRYPLACVCGKARERGRWMMAKER